MHLTKTGIPTFAPPNLPCYFSNQPHIEPAATVCPSSSYSSRSNHLTSQNAAAVFLPDHQHLIQLLSRHRDDTHHWVPPSLVHWKLQPHVPSFAAGGGKTGDFWFWAQFLRKSVKYRNTHPNINPFHPETALI